MRSLTLPICTVVILTCRSLVGARTVSDALLADGFVVVDLEAPAEAHAGIQMRLSSLGQKEMVQPGLLANIGAHVPELAAIFETPNTRATLEALLGSSYAMDFAYAFTAGSYEDNKDFHQEVFEAGQQNFRHLHTTRVLGIYYPQAVTPSMGPTRLIPGSHYLSSEWSLRYHGYPGASSELDVTDFQPVSICAPGGSLLLMHYNLWHAGTQPQLGSPPRWAVSINFHRLSHLDSRGAPVSVLHSLPICADDEIAAQLHPSILPPQQFANVLARVASWNEPLSLRRCEVLGQDLDDPFAWARVLLHGSSKDKLLAAERLATAPLWGGLAQHDRLPLTRRLLLSALLFGSHMTAIIVAQAASWAIRADAECELDWKNALARGLTEIVAGWPWSGSSDWWLEEKIEPIEPYAWPLPQQHVRRFAAASALAGVSPLGIPHDWAQMIMPILMNVARRQNPENGMLIYVASCHEAEAMGLPESHEERKHCMDGNPSVQAAAVEGLGWLGPLAPAQSLEVMLSTCADWGAHASSDSLWDFDDGRVCFSALLAIARLLIAVPGLCQSQSDCIPALRITAQLAYQIHPRFGRCWRCAEAFDTRASILFAARLALTSAGEAEDVQIANRYCPHMAHIAAEHFRTFYAMPSPLVMGAEAQQGCLEISEGRACLPRVGLGLGHVQGKAEQASILVERWLRLGGRHIDTALAYRHGHAVREGLARSGIPRGEIVVVSKVPLEALGFDATEASIQAIVGELGSPVDLMLLHSPGRGPGFEGDDNAINPPCVEVAKGQRSWARCRRGSWAALEQAMRQGHVRAIGVSNFGIAHLQELFKIAEIRPAVNQIEFHPYWQDMPLVEFCHAERIQPIAFGLFAGFWDPVLRTQLLENPLLTSIGARYGRSSAQVLLRWGLTLGLAVLPAARTLEQMEANLRAGFDDWSLADGEVQAISTMVPSDQRHRRYATLDDVDFVL